MTTIINGSSNINLDYSTGGRITGDFSNATQANRVLFQSSTADANTAVQCVPNGTATTSGFGAFNSSDPANAGRWYINATSSLVNMSADKTGTGSYLPMTFNTGGSESLRLSETSKAVILSGGSTSANGTGITFPATQSASTDANTLDDYEEGTWTPLWGASSGSMTYSAQVGRYVKVGRQVIATCHIVTNVNTSLTGNIYLTGLPFTSDSSAGNYVACPMHVERVNLAASAWIWSHIGPGTTTADVRYWNNNAGAGYLNANTLLNGADIMVTCSYVTT